MIIVLETDTVIFGPQNLSFGRPGACTLAPWGTMARSRGAWEHKNKDLGVQAWIFIDFGWISGPHFESLSGYLGPTFVFLFVLGAFRTPWKQLF